MKNVVTIFVLIFLTSFRLINRLTKRPQGKAPLKIGHRGAAGYCPENTFASFNKALELGVDFLEIDIQMTRDGELIIIHDPTVNRTTNGKGRVKDLTLKEIHELDAGSWFHPRFAGEKVPTFSEFLDKYAGVTGLLIELKKPSLYPQIEEKVATELIKRGLASEESKQQIIIQSFDKISLKRVHHLLPSVPIGVLIKNTVVNGLSTNELIGFSSFASYVNPKITMINKRLIKRIQRHGFKTIIWTVKKKSDAKLLRHFDINGIVSDYPDYI
ncbi:glycerophosphodiester phosphodiesterase family protein [Neobacillus drentensis]|uniref:glycerophosphodiester phosphodiesterase n=1 Tax=Neobacillus drentensis TaxID=220684 RepID=UPI0030009794